MLLGEYKILKYFGEKNRLASYENKNYCIKLSNEDEIKTLKTLDHPNIIKIVNTLDNEDKYIVYEYFEGEESYIWRKNINTPSFLEKVIKQLCETISYIHSKNFIYGDLSVRNVIINNNNEIKLIDFETCKELGKHKETKGIFLYFSPEILKGEMYTKSTDLWALGVLTFYLLLEKFPFEGNSEKFVYARIMNKKINYSKYVMSKKYIIFFKNLLKRNPIKRKIIFP